MGPLEQKSYLFSALKFPSVILSETKDLDSSATPQNDRELQRAKELQKNSRKCFRPPVCDRERVTGIVRGWEPALRGSQTGFFLCRQASSKFKRSRTKVPFFIRSSESLFVAERPSSLERS